MDNLRRATLCLCLSVFLISLSGCGIAGGVVGIAAVADIGSNIRKNREAKEKQDAIANAFPGYRILNISEFNPEVPKTVKTNPALVTGRFNDDNYEDFAAMIRSGDANVGKIVVCHGDGQRHYQCQVLDLLGLVTLEQLRYLSTVKKPGRIGCFNEAGTKKDSVTVKGDAIYYAPGLVYIYQPDGSYFQCITED